MLESPAANDGLISRIRVTWREANELEVIGDADYRFCRVDDYEGDYVAVRSVGIRFA